MLVKLRTRKPEVVDLPPPAVPRGGKLTLILKATNVCNIACTFCSVGPAGKEVLSWEDFERLADELERTVREWNLGELEVTFHGGEPTALGAEWIDRACRRLKEIPTRVVLSMQSNIISFSDKMMEVASEHDIRIGSSIDPLFGERVDIRGGDTYARWVANYRKLTEAGFRVGAIFIVTKKAVPYARELYQACEALVRYSGQPFGLQVQPVYAQGRAADDLDMLLTPEEFGRFLVDLHDEWERSGRTVNLTPIHGWSDALTGVQGSRVGRLCAFGPGCATSHVGVDHDLNVAGCGRRLDSSSMFGNLKNGHLTEIVLNSVEKRKLAARTDHLYETECKSCRYFRICHGGCPDDAGLAYDDVSKKSYWCESYKMLFGRIEASAAGEEGSPDQPAATGGTAVPVTEGRQLVVFASDSVADLAVPFDESGIVERWLLPTEDGAGLREDLGALLRHRATLVRVFVHNGQARLLRRFQHVVQHPAVRVVLFEGNDELATALNLLNALDANVVLDLPSICRTADGAAQATQALRRFLTDPLWRVQLNPFAPMLRAAIEGMETPWIDRWGLPPAGFQSVFGAGLEERVRGYSGEVVRELRGEEQSGAAAWLDEHRACADCRLRPICGGQLSARRGALCSADELAVVDRVREEARELVSRLSTQPGEA